MMRTWYNAFGNIIHNILMFCNMSHIVWLKMKVNITHTKIPGCFKVKGWNSNSDNYFYGQNCHYDI